VIYKILNINYKKHILDKLKILGELMIKMINKFNYKIENLLIEIQPLNKHFHIKLFKIIFCIQVRIKEILKLLRIIYITQAISKVRIT
jgi:hypothetical protein